MIFNQMKMKSKKNKMKNSKIFLKLKKLNGP